MLGRPRGGNGALTLESRLLLNALVILSLDANGFDIEFGFRVMKARYHGGDIVTIDPFGRRATFAERLVDARYHGPNLKPLTEHLVMYGYQTNLKYKKAAGL